MHSRIQLICLLFLLLKPLVSDSVVTPSDYSNNPFNDPNKPTDGATFTHIGTLTASNGFHIITLELPLEKILQNVVTHVNRLITFEDSSFFKTLSPYIRETTYNTRVALQRSLASVSSLANDIRFDVSPREDHHFMGKRGLINAVGTTAEYLFGVATQSEIYALTSSLNYVNATAGALLNQINVHTTILNKLSPDIEALQTTVNSLAKTVYEIANDVNDEQEILALTYEMLNADRLISKMTNLNLGLRLMRSGEFSYEIVSHELFMNALRTLESQGVQLLFKPDLRTLIYPHLSKILTLPNMENDNIRFAIIIPTNKVSESLDLFQLQTNYIFNATMKVAFRYKYTYDYMGVSPTTHSVALLKSLEKCRKFAGQFWCPLGYQLYNSGRTFCETALFYKKAPQEACDVEITHMTEPVFTPSKKGFYYSCGEETEVLVRCSKGDVPKSLTVVGNGELILRSGCTLRYQGVLLYAPINVDEALFEKHADWVILEEDTEKESVDFSQVIEALEKINTTGLRDMDLGSDLSYSVLTNSLRLLSSVQNSFLPAPGTEGNFEITMGLIIILVMGCLVIRALCCIKDKCLSCLIFFKCCKHKAKLSKTKNIKLLDRRMQEIDQRTEDLENLLLPKSQRRRNAAGHLNQNAEEEAAEVLLLNPLAQGEQSGEPASALAGSQTNLTSRSKQSTAAGSAVLGTVTGQPIASFPNTATVELINEMQPGSSNNSNRSTLVSLVSSNYTSTSSTASEATNTIRRNPEKPNQDQETFL